MRYISLYFLSLRRPTLRAARMIHTIQSDCGQGSSQGSFAQGSSQTFAQGPSQQGAFNPYLGNSEPQIRSMPQHPLPIRDVPHDTTGYQQDVTIKPNYIPKPRDMDETYVYEQEDRIRRQKRAKKQKMFSDWKFDDIVAELQQPIIVAVLFLVFQSPTLHILMAKYLTFLPLFGETGDLTVTGSLFKSAVFGAVYFGLIRFMAYIE